MNFSCQKQRKKSNQPPTRSTWSARFKLDAFPSYITSIEGPQCSLSCPHIIEFDEFMMALVRCFPDLSRHHNDSKPLLRGVTSYLQLKFMTCAGRTDGLHLNGRNSPRHYEKLQKVIINKLIFHFKLKPIHYLKCSVPLSLRHKLRKFGGGHH